MDSDSDISSDGSSSEGSEHISNDWYGDDWWRGNSSSSQFSTSLFDLLLRDPEVPSWYQFQVYQKSFFSSPPLSSSDSAASGNENALVIDSGSSDDSYSSNVSDESETGPRNIVSSKCNCGFASRQGSHTQTANCDAYKAACGNLEAEEANLLARPVPSTLAKVPAAFDPYIRARFATAKALVRFGTKRAEEEALGHFNALLRVFRADDLRSRDYIPHLLLKLHRDQECYDFIKWWATVNDADHYRGGYDWNDATLPFLNIHNADPFERPERLCASRLSLSHLVALTLLKLRLYLDTCSIEQVGADNHAVFKPRVPGRVAFAKFKLLKYASPNDTDEERQAKDYPTRYVLHEQYTKLIQAVHAANPNFWETLVNSLTHWTSSDNDEAPSPFTACPPGYKEEADLVVSQSKSAWKIEEVVSETINLSTSDLVSVYQSPASTDTFPTLTELRFPSKFQPDPPTSNPRDVFHPPLLGNPANPANDRFYKNGNAKATELLVYTGGACVKNGQLGSRGAWAVAYKEPGAYKGVANGIVSGRLENRGLEGEITEATSRRADLRAAVAALRLCNWRKGLKIKGLVIATHSSYVVDVATFWAKRLMPSGWKTWTGDNVENRDLWVLLFREVKWWHVRGLRVQFWKIDEKLNQLALTAAKEATSNELADVEEFTDISIDDNQKLMTTHWPLHDCRRVLGLDIDEPVHWTLPWQLYKQFDFLARSQPDALRYLNGELAPSVIVVTNGFIASGASREMFEGVADNLRQGTTVIIIGEFAKDEGDFNRFFARLGVPWRYSREGDMLVAHKRVILDQGYANQLKDHDLYTAHCVYLKNVARSESWYSPCLEDFVGEEAPVAFTRVGKGMLGFVGDVNVNTKRDRFANQAHQGLLEGFEKVSMDIVMVMCRLPVLN